MELMTRYMLGEHLEERESQTVHSLVASHQLYRREAISRLRAKWPQGESSEYVKYPNPESSCQRNCESFAQHWENTLRLSIRPAVALEPKRASRLGRCLHKTKATACRLLEELNLR
jgi:hypothetical protein